MDHPAIKWKYVVRCLRFRGVEPGAVTLMVRARATEYRDNLGRTTYATKIERRADLPATCQAEC